MEHFKEYSENTMTQYKVCTDNGEFLDEAQFFLGSGGQIFVLTSFGNFAYYFGSMGTDIKTFILGCDKWYFAGKMEYSHGRTHRTKMRKSDIIRIQNLFEDLKKGILANQ